MAQTNVSSCVHSIVDSFATGLDVFKKLREKKRGKRHVRKKERHAADDEEQRLSRSLRQGPEDIGREYQKSVHAAGDRYAVGDAIAQTCLAEILLKLNTGLVGIITAFLTARNGTENARIDYRALTDLSERSRVDTCHTLRQWFRRLTHSSRAPKALTSRYIPEAKPQNKSDVSSRQSRRNRRASPNYAKVRGPMIARVVVQNSSKPSQIAMVKPGERRKKFTSSSTGASALSRATSDPACSAPLTPLPPYSVEPPLPQMQPVQRPSGRRSHTALVVGTEQSQPRHHSSTANLPRQRTRQDEVLRATRSTSRLPDSPPSSSPPAMMPAQPRSTFRHRKQTPTYYSMASDGTQLGEIPLHKWAVPFDFDQMSVINRQALAEGWPVNSMDGSGTMEKKRKFGFLRIFGRN